LLEQLAAAIAARYLYFLDSFDYATLKRELLDPLGPDVDASFRRAAFDYRVDRAVVSPRQVAPRERADIVIDNTALDWPRLVGRPRGASDG
jgi:uridine kinase